MAIFSILRGKGLKFDMSASLSDGSDVFENTGAGVSLWYDDGSYAIASLDSPLRFGNVKVTDVGIAYDIGSYRSMIYDIHYYTGGGATAMSLEGINLIISNLDVALVGMGADLWAEITTQADTFHGAELADVIHGGPGGDAILGFKGADRLFGDAGDDQLFGEAGDDVLKGGRGHDGALGGGGRDAIYGGVGKDALFGNGGADLIKGGMGADIIGGGVGNDELRGGGGSDIIKGGGGRDVMYGGAGRDAFIFVGNFGKDVIRDFRPGVDVIDATGLTDRQLANADYYDVDGDAVFVVGRSTLTLEGVSISDLGDGDILL